MQVHNARSLEPALIFFHPERPFVDSQHSCCDNHAFGMPGNKSGPYFTMSCKSFLKRLMPFA